MRTSSGRSHHASRGEAPKRKPVDLEKDDSRRVRTNTFSATPSNTLRYAERVGVVIVGPEHDIEDDAECRSDERNQEG